MSDWILTDDSTGQHVLKPVSEGEVYHFIDTVALGEDEYAVVTDTIDLDCNHGYDVHSEGFLECYLRPYDYKSFEALRALYGESAMQIAAKCVFETHAFDAAVRFKGSLDECIQYIDRYVAKENAH